MECYAFDIDGVIVDATERLMKALSISGGRNRRFWEVFFSPDLILKLDKPRVVGIKLVRDRASKGCIIIITGRPRRLKDVSLHEVIKFTNIRPRAIFMRRNNDFRPSHIVKVELLSTALRIGYHILEFHDDSEDVLKHIGEEYPDIILIYHFNNSYKVLR